MGLWRRINVLVYLNENWGYNNGHLDLWDAATYFQNVTDNWSHRAFLDHVHISPIMNRVVIFATTR